jgi:two-component system, cell cycle sensor histidine kinase and response regulator CckA
MDHPADQHRETQARIEKQVSGMRARQSGLAGSVASWEAQPAGGKACILAPESPGLRCLAGGIAHEYNNLLTIITGYSELILRSERCRDAELQNDMEEIKGAAERGALLTRKIMAFSRVQILQPRIVSANEIVRAARGRLEALLGHRIALVLALGRDVGCIEVDAEKMERVLADVTLNASDAMPDGGSLTVRTRAINVDGTYPFDPALSPGPYVAFCLSDTGAGMDDEVRSRVFDPFFTTKEPGKGSGLGLSAVYGTIAQSHGGVAVQSAPGRGTTVNIYLPQVAPGSYRHTREHLS